MSGLGRAIDRGLHVVGRIREDWSPFALFVVLVAAVFGLAAAIWITVARHTAHDWHVFGVYVLSEFLLVAFARDKTKKIRDLDGEVLVWTIDAITRHSYILDLRDRMLGDALGAALWGGGIGAGLLIGTVVVKRIVYWRKARKRRRGAGEKRAAVASRCRTGLSLDRILRCLSASLRFVSKAVMRIACAGGTGRCDAKPAVGKHHAVDAAAGGFGHRRRLGGLLAPLGELTLRLLAAVRSVRQHRTKAAEAYWEQRQLALGRHVDSVAHEHSPDASMPATSPPVATASAPAGQSETADAVRSGPTNRKSYPPGQDSHDVRVPQGGDGAPPGTGPSQQSEAAARNDGSNDAASPAPRSERVASADKASGSSARPPPVGTRLGARKRNRRRASQDFY